jgi:hypothetical protein
MADRKMNNAVFFSNLCFLYNKPGKERMLAILEKDREKTKKRVEGDLESVLILLSEGNNYWEHFEKMALRGFEVSCKNLWKYKNYLLSTFKSFDVHQPKLNIKPMNYDSFFNEYREAPKPSETTAEFLYSIHFGYKFIGNDGVINGEMTSKIASLLNKNPKSSKFFLEMDMKHTQRYVSQNPASKTAKDYLQYLNAWLHKP